MQKQNRIIEKEYNSLEEFGKEYENVMVDFNEGDVNRVVEELSVKVSEELDRFFDSKSIVNVGDNGDVERSDKKGPSTKSSLN